MPALAPEDRADSVSDARPERNGDSSREAPGHNP